MAKGKRSFENWTKSDKIKSYQKYVEKYTELSKKLEGNVYEIMSYERYLSTYGLAREQGMKNIQRSIVKSAEKVTTKQARKWASLAKAKGMDVNVSDFKKNTKIAQAIWKDIEKSSFSKIMY